DRLQRRHHGLDPVRDLLVAGAGLGRLAGRVRFEFLRHAIPPCWAAGVPSRARTAPRARDGLLLPAPGSRATADDRSAAQAAWTRSLRRGRRTGCCWLRAG